MSANPRNQDPIAALEAFQKRYLQLWAEQRGGLPQQTFDPDWPSPCQQSEPDSDGQITWQPLRRDEPGSFSNVEAAIEISLHPDLCAYYSHHFSDALGASHPHGDLNLLGAWNQRDFERLQENLLGHLHEQRRAKRKPTLFFATCEPEDSPHFLSIDNVSGAVLLEEVGIGPKETLADSLAEFLDQLEPRLP